MVANVSPLAPGAALHPRCDVLLELVCQQGLRKLERAALVEVRVALPVHPGHGQDVDAGGVVVFLDGGTARQIKVATDLDGDFSARPHTRMSMFLGGRVSSRRAAAHGWVALGDADDVV